jgi:hypothetical protein
MDAPTLVFARSEKIILQMLHFKEDEMGRACSTNGGEEECI